MYVPTEGTVLLDGVPLNGKKVHQFVETGIARTFQNIRLFTDMTVIENVKAACAKDLHYTLFDAAFRTPRFWKAERETTEKALELLEICGLRDKADAAASVILEQSLPPVPVKAAGTLCRDSQILMVFLVSIPLRSFALSPDAAMLRIFLAFARERKYHLLWESCAESAIKNEALL